jgi:hypothetical protein
MYPFLAKLFADAGYQGPQFATAVAEVLPHLSIEIVVSVSRWPPTGLADWSACCLGLVRAG